MSTVKFKRSGVKDKKPLASQLSLGEIAINFNDENPFISTLTNEGNVVEFPSKEGVQGLIDDALGEYQPGSGGTVDAYTKTETDQLLAGKSDVNHEHSQYLTASDIEGKADKSELNNYLTTSAATNTYATKTDLNGKADSVHSHSYNDLTDKPVIPSIEGLETSQHASETYQPKGDYLTQTSADERYAQIGDTPTDVYTKTETDQLLAGKANSAHTHDYETLTNKPDLSNFATKGEIPDTSNFITSGFCEDHYQPKGTYVVPSDLNDYALKSELPSIEGLETSAHAEATYQPKGNYLTEHQDISGKADKSELNDYLKTSAATETYATKAELENYQLVSAMSGYSTTSHTHPQYVTSGDVEGMLSEFTPTGSTGNNVWHGTYAEYVALAEKDDDTLYCITDVSQQYMTRGEADALYMPLSGMSGYVTTSAATATYATKTELSGYARVISISQSDYDTLVSNDQVQQGVLYCIIESSN